MGTSIIIALRRQEGFTATDEAIANYVLTHLASCASMNIGDLARETHSSKSAIMRLCQRLGLDGYRTFRLQLAREVEHAYAFGVNPDRPFMRESDEAEVARSIAALQKKAIDDTQALLDPGELRQAGRLIVEAPHVVLYGIGDSVSACDQLSGLLLKSGIFSVSGHSQNDLLAMNAALQPGDLAIIVSYSGGLFRHFTLVPEAVRTQGLKTVAVTSETRLRGDPSELAAFIQLPRYENPAERIAPFYSQACVRYALTCIYGEVLAATWERSFAGQQRLSQVGAMGD